MLLKFCSNLSLEPTGSTLIHGGESVILKELKGKISELEETLRGTRTQLDNLKVELTMQKTAVANFTTQVTTLEIYNLNGPLRRYDGHIVFCCFK